MARFSALLLTVAAMACASEVNVGGQQQPQNEAVAMVAADGVDDAPASSPSPADDGDDDTGNDDEPTPTTPDDTEEPTTPVDPGPPPAEANQDCAAWTDCGPWYDDLNSGFDCLSGTCVCNAEGNWDDACASIGGVWSDADCFCFVGASSMPSEDADEWVADDEEEYEEDDVSDPRADRTCWWTWRETCEPDRWVDTSDYEYVCDSGGDCSYEYEEDGYWESGDCDGYWLRRCDDGTEKRY